MSCMQEAGFGKELPLLFVLWVWPDLGPLVLATHPALASGPLGLSAPPLPEALKETSVGSHL